MFTVLIAEQEHIDAIQQGNKLFFEPFLENKELAFCSWNPAGQNLRDSVPGLLDLVGRRKDWRAVIINNCDPEFQKTQNPFDTVDHSALAELAVPQRQPGEKESWEHWVESWENYYDSLAKAKEEIYKSALEKPLQKLATWLCFRPENYILNDVQEKQDVHDWALEILSRDEVKPSMKLEAWERAQYKSEQRMKENLRRAFAADKYLNVAYPAEIQCISIRTADNNFFDPDTFWNTRQVNEYSTFADRNMYFDKMRFLVFDLLPRTHRNYRTDYIRFLASVLIFVSNAVPGSAMQARRLYQLEAETDDTPLCTLVTSYDKKLANTLDVIDAEMDKIRGEIPGELSDKTAESLFCMPKEVSLQLDESVDMDEVFAEKNFGLFFDSPEDELQKWQRSYRQSEKAITYIAKQQARAIRKSTSQIQMSDEISDVNVSRLTPMQIEDVREFTEAAERELVESTPPDLDDISRYMGKLEEESAKVKKVLRRRMTRKTALGLLSTCMILFIVCLLPFLFDNSGNPATVVTAIVFTGIVLGVFVAIMIASLFFLRSSVNNAVRSYNSAARGVVNEIQDSLKCFSTYLSAAFNVRRGYAIQNYAKQNVDEYTRSLRIRKKHQEDIRKRRAYLNEEYEDYFGDKSVIDETMSRPYEYDFNLRMEYEYPAPFLAGDYRQIEFLSSGNYVTVPSSYVTRILIRMEGIYE